MDKTVEKLLNYHMSPERRYLESHPFISFKTGTLIEDLGPGAWLRLGDAYSKCAFLLGAPIGRQKAFELSQVYLRRGAWATAQIEGNPLTEVEVNQLLDQGTTAASTEKYQEQEILNVMKVLQGIEAEVSGRLFAPQSAIPLFELSEDWVKRINLQLLENLEVPDHVHPGVYRTVEVGVMRYRAAPVEDVPFLMDKFCSWINELIVNAQVAEREQGAGFGFACLIIAAILAHLYFAWIHPFGDGNGRTARMIECAILAHSGLVPWISTNILSDYYNRTRDNYYQRLDAASDVNDLVGFVRYGIKGFLDQVTRQVNEVQNFQRQISWVSYIHEKYSGIQVNEKLRRQKNLALRLEEGSPKSVRNLISNDPYISKWYSTLSSKTLKRDLDELVKFGLVATQDRKTYEANVKAIDGFKPLPEFGSHLTS